MLQAGGEKGNNAQNKMQISWKLNSVQYLASS